tara:strand:- start:279 stop:671 length:393 start_codon:yes stop_codon:yes gene_type:complete
MGGGKVKLADFGISKAVSGGNVLNVSKMGTPIYASPEVLRKQPFDFKIDIWALGCIVHYIASLEIPFSTKQLDKSPNRKNQAFSPKQILEEQILSSTPKMIPDFYSNYLQMIINRLLNKNPNERPSSDEL